MRARLLEALCLSTPPCQDHLDDLCELLPVVRAIVAEELVYAAKWLHTSREEPGYRWLVHRAAEWDPK